MRRLGLIGYPLTHSFSGNYFAKKFEREKITDHRYDLFPIASIDELPNLLFSHPDLVGLNVTIPYKEKVLPYLTEMSPEVQAIGACNCIAIRQGSLIGYNTDVIGFARTLERHLQSHHQRALVLGTGGAAKAVYHVLREKGISFTKVSRNAKDNCLAYSDVDQHLIESHQLIINTTPLGMFPDTESKPALSYDAITSNHYLYDLVYNPSRTAFLLEGERRGAVVENGMDMLLIQAEASWDIWSEGLLKNAAS